MTIELEIDGGQYKIYRDKKYIALIHIVEAPDHTLITVYDETMPPTMHDNNIGVRQLSIKYVEEKKRALIKTSKRELHYKK